MKFVSFRTVFSSVLTNSGFSVEKRSVAKLYKRSFKALVGVSFVVFVVSYTVFPSTSDCSFTGLTSIGSFEVKVLLLIYLTTEYDCKTLVGSFVVALSLNFSLSIDISLLTNTNGCVCLSVDGKFETCLLVFVCTPLIFGCAVGPVSPLTSINGFTIAILAE